MNEVKLDARELGGELRQAVDASLLPSPIKPAPPVANQVLEI
jgi:hypothetical protein